MVVAGGGIAGLAAALALARQGAQVTVLERAPAIREFGAGLQITPNGGVVLEALGLGAAMRDAGLRALAVTPRDGLTGRVLARFDLTGLPGVPYRFLHRADLIALLARAAQASGVTLRTGCAVTRIDPDGRVTLEGGEVLAPDLAIGAEGLHSVLRPVLDPGVATTFTGQVAWRAVIAGRAPPEAQIWMAPRCHVVTYPLPDDRINIVAVREQTGWAAEGWNHADDPAHLREAFAPCAAPLRALLAQVSDVRLWGLFRHPVAARWHGPAAALVGDAAHPTLPFLAQGANLALEDAFVLAQATDRSADLPAALAAYQARRVPRVTRAIAAANANARTYHLGGLRRHAAHAGLRLAHHLAPGAVLSRLDWLYRHDVTKAQAPGARP